MKQVTLDNNNRQNNENRMLASNTLLRLLSTISSRKDYLDTVAGLIHDWSGCRCVGIRIVHDDGDIPYEPYVGFSREFWESETRLSLRHDQCACTRVILKTPEPQDVQCMTAYGSFRCDNTIVYMAGLSKQEQARFRGVCVRSGFKSLAIVPIFYAGKVIAAAHLADEREQMVSPKFIDFFETMVPLIGEAIHKLDAEEDRTRLAAAVESATDAVIITNVRGIIQYVNCAFEQITGFAKEEAVGNDLHILDSGKQDAVFYQEVQETLKRDGVWIGQLINKKKDGTLYFEACTCFPVKEPAGDIVNYVSIKRDVTEKLMLESIAESVSLTDNIGYIFAGIRHEIGDPVSTLLVLLELLQSRLDNGPPEVIKNYVNQALKQVSKVENVLTSLKNFNMFETLDCKNVELRPFFEKFLSLVTEDFTKQGIAIDVMIEPDADVVYADMRGLQQVLLNLFTNAAAALNNRQVPKITVRVSRAQNLANMVMIRVEDNGCGMTAEERKNLFRPFYTTKPRGTGLGIVIVKKMLTKMNGTIEIESGKNEGTIAKVFLPRGNP